LRQVPERLMAARTYSGTWSRENYRENERALLEAVEQAGLKPAGEPVWARYNPPLMPWFLRRNEVLVEVRPQP
ncbi:MAG TPA: heme-binding protein, partial [Pelomicrobium sp.]|nr:heme-binding protein [Pelomicrobium sp.]